MTEKYNVQIWALLGPKFAAKPGARYSNKFASGTNDRYINTGIRPKCRYLSCKTSPVIGSGKRQLYLPDQIRTTHRTLSDSVLQTEPCCLLACSTVSIGTYCMTGKLPEVQLYRCARIAGNVKKNELSSGNIIQWYKNIVQNCLKLLLLVIYLSHRKTVIGNLHFLFIMHRNYINLPDLTRQTDGTEHSLLFKINIFHQTTINPASHVILIGKQPLPVNPSILFFKMLKYQHWNSCVKRPTNIDINSVTVINIASIVTKILFLYISC